MAKAKTNTNIQSVVTAAEAVDISAADHTFANTVRGMYIGGDGDLVVRLAGDDADVTFKGVRAGSTLPYAVSIVRRTNTTATFLIGLI